MNSIPAVFHCCPQRPAPDIENPEPQPPGLSIPRPAMPSVPALLKLAVGATVAVCSGTYLLAQSAPSAEPLPFEPGSDALALPGALLADAMESIRERVAEPLGEISTTLPVETAPADAGPANATLDAGQLMEALVDSGVRNFFIAGRLRFEREHVPLASSLLDSIASHGESATFHFYAGKADEPDWQQELHATSRPNVTFHKLSENPLDLDALVRHDGFDVASLTMREAFAETQATSTHPHVWRHKMPGEQTEGAISSMPYLFSSRTFERAQQREASAILFLESDLAGLGIPERNRVLQELQKDSTFCRLDLPGVGPVIFFAQPADPAPLAALAARNPSLKLEAGPAWAAGRTVAPASGPQAASSELQSRMAQYASAGVRKAMLGELHGCAFNMEAVARLTAGMRDALGHAHLYTEIGYVPPRWDHAGLLRTILDMHERNSETFHGHGADPHEEELFFRACDNERDVTLQALQFISPYDAARTNFFYRKVPSVAWMGLSHAISKLVQPNVLDEPWPQEAQTPVDPAFRVNLSAPAPALRRAFEQEKALFDLLGQMLAQPGPPPLLVINTENFPVDDLRRMRTHLRGVQVPGHWWGSSGLEVRSEAFAGADGHRYTIDFWTSAEVHARVDAMQAEQQSRA